MRWESWFLDEVGVSWKAANLWQDHKDAALVNTQEVSYEFGRRDCRLSPSHGKWVAISNFKGKLEQILMRESHYFDWEQLASYSPVSPQVALCGNGALRGAEISGMTVHSFVLSLTHENDPGSSLRDFISPFFHHRWSTVEQGMMGNSKHRVCSFELNRRHKIIGYIL